MPIKSSNIAKEDKTSKSASSLIATFFHKTKYFILWFLGFFGFLSMNMSCPCCGNPVCQSGLGFVALISGFFAFIVQFGRNILSGIRALSIKIWKKLLNMF